MKSDCLCENIHECAFCDYVNDVIDKWNKNEATKKFELFEFDCVKFEKGAFIDFIIIDAF